MFLFIVLENSSFMKTSGRYLCIYLLNISFLIPVMTCEIEFSPDPNIQLPLLNHIWLNYLDNNYRTGVMLSDLTDHSPVFYK